MPYSPISFSPNAPIVADDVDGALSDLRGYINRGIDASDFLSDIVETEDVLEGDPVGASRTDFWAVSGDIHAQHGDSARVNRQYLTGTSVAIGDYTTTYEYTQALPGCSKTFYLEREAIVVMTCWLMTIAGESNLSSNTIDPESGIFFVSSSGANIYPQAKIFVEDSVATAAAAGPQPAGSAMNRRPYSFTNVEVLPAGLHTYKILVDLHSEKMFVSARNMTIEVLYL